MGNGSMYRGTPVMAEVDLSLVEGTEQAGQLEGLAEGPPLAARKLQHNQM